MTQVHETPLTQAWAQFRSPFALPQTSQPSQTAVLLTPSQLKTWQRCKARFYYHVLQQCRWPTDQSNFELGQSVHQLMDYQARNLDVGPLVAHATQEIQQAYQALVHHPLAQAPCVASEWAFHLPITVGDAVVWLTGRMDRVVVHQNMLTVVDWKTGTAIPKHPESDWQTRVYLAALAELQHQLPHLSQSYTPEQLSFAYVGVNKHGEVTVKTVPYSQAAHQRNLADIVEVVAAIRAEDTFAITHPCPDKYCAYRGVCGIEDSGG